MDPLATPLVLTKLRAPAARQRTIPRTRLVELLSADDGAGVLLVCAPAGYGKTTLLADWAYALAKAGVAVAWLSLDPEDDDPISFGAYLTASLIQALGALPELVQIAQLLRSAAEIDLQRILPALINCVVSGEKECVLILDDYHLIGSPAVHSALVYLIEHLPGNLRVAIGSRSDPPLPLARLRARGQMREVRTAALRFTPGEAGQFLNQAMRLDLSEQGIATLEERTEGWIAGLQLAALSVSGRANREDFIAAFSGGQRYLVDYLMEEVVSRQPVRVQAFLLATSVLERMSGELCDALCGPEAAGAETLRQLELDNLFVIALDDQGEWFRYHHLFRDFLQTRLKKTQPERIPMLHRAACEWLAGQGLLREAARHAFLSGNWEYAAAFVEQHTFSLIIYSEIATIYEWCAVFPEEVMQRHPLLCIQQALALAYGFRRQNRERVEARLEQAESMIAALEDRDAAQGLVDLVSVVKAFQAFAPDPAADPLELLALARQMTGAYPEGSPARFSGLLVTGYAHLALQQTGDAARALEEARGIARRERLYFGMVESSFHLARLVQAQGRLRAAAQLCLQARADIAAALGQPEQTLPALGSLDVALGGVLLEQNRLGEAEQRLLRGLERMGGGMNPYYLMAAHIGLFRLYEILGRFDEARKYLDRLEAVWPDLAFCTQGLKARQALRQAPEDPAARADAAMWRQGYEALTGGEVFLAGLGPLGAAEAYYLASLAWAEIQISLGKPRAALAYLEKQIELAAANGLENRVIELRVLQALGRRAEGDDRGALEALEEALATAAPEGYLRTFDQGPALAGLLAGAAQKGVRREYIQQILAATGGSGEAAPAPAAQTVSGESLSERELEVLHMIAAGASNQEVAEKLVITVGTVKSHMNHILGKLGAHNRTEAVARARALGLLKI